MDRKLIDYMNGQNHGIAYNGYSELGAQNPTTPKPYESPRSPVSAPAPAQTRYREPRTPPPFAPKRADDGPAIVSTPRTPGLLERILFQFVWAGGAGVVIGLFAFVMILGTLVDAGVQQPAAGWLAAPVALGIGLFWRTVLMIAAGLCAFGFLILVLLGG